MAWGSGGWRPDDSGGRATAWQSTAGPGRPARQAGWRLSRAPTAWHNGLGGGCAGASTAQHGRDSELEGGAASRGRRAGGRRGEPDGGGVRWPFSSLAAGVSVNYFRCSRKLINICRWEL
jgi:hypothetical protein